MELSVLKIKCGFICARNAWDSMFAIFLFNSVLRFSRILIRWIRKRIERIRANNKIQPEVIMKNQVFQNGRSIVNVNVAGSLFQMPSLLELMTLNVYVAGGRLE